jgi:hypothetical protein
LDSSPQRESFAHALWIQEMASQRLGLINEPVVVDLRCEMIVYIDHAFVMRLATCSEALHLMLLLESDKRTASGSVLGVLFCE